MAAGRSHHEYAAWHVHSTLGVITRSYTIGTGRVDASAEVCSPLQRRPLGRVAELHGSGTEMNGRNGEEIERMQEDFEEELECELQELIDADNRERARDMNEALRDIGSTKL